MFSAAKASLAKVGLDLTTVLRTAKAALAPTIGIAMYQGDGVSETYSTSGYLIAIAAVLSFALAPRARFIESMIFDVVLVCLAAALTLLGVWSGLKAREHTTTPGDLSSDYNSSQSTVCAVWFFFLMYLNHCLKSAMPQAKFACILAAIFMTVGLLYGSAFTSVAECTTFVQTLLQAMLTGCALATGVSLFLVPVNCRQIVFKEMNNYLQGVRKVLKAQTAYMKSLETSNMFRMGNGDPVHTSDDENRSEVRASAVEKAAELKAAVSALRTSHGKIHTEMAYAKKEIAFGMFDASDMSQAFRLFRRVFLPLIGESALVGIFERIAGIHGWDKEPLEGEENIPRSRAEQHRIDDWQAIMGQLYQPFEDMRIFMDAAIQHILVTMQFSKPTRLPSEDTDNQEEVKEDDIVQYIGTDNFAEQYQAKVDKFYTLREGAIGKWYHSNSTGQVYNSTRVLSKESDNDEPTELRQQRELLIVLYLEYLFWMASQGLLNLVRFADSHKASGKFERNRLVFPGLKRLLKWISSLTAPLDTLDSTNDTASFIDGFQDIYLGKAYHTRLDPEHRKPKGRSQQWSSHILAIPAFFRSDHSAHGFRVAVAMMSIAIPAFLKNTHAWFIEQRAFWAVIMVSVSMARTTGQALFIYSLRMLATILGMISCYPIYYIPDGHTAGVLVIFFLVMLADFYIVVKYPKFLLLGQVAAIVPILVIGYALQAAKVGRRIAESNGQEYYPVSLLAPFRLGATAAGVIVAFFFTVFPFPVSETSELRRNVGAGLYLAAKHYTIVHETVRAYIHGSIGNSAVKGTPAYTLEKARMAVFSKQMLLIERMKSELEFSKWQLNVGGEFPANVYADIIKCLENILDYTAVLGYCSTTFMPENGITSDRWKADLHHILAVGELTSHQISSVLSLLSSSILNAQPLPPHLRMPQAYQLLTNLQALDQEVLNVKHIADPGYAAFAVVQIASRNIVTDVQKLKGLVEELVGEFDFSVHDANAATSLLGA